MDQMKIEDQHPDLLQNIEFVVAQLYRKHPDMTDYSVVRVYEALIDLYSGERIGRPPRLAVGAGLEQETLDATKGICEWRLGRNPLPAEDSGEPAQSPETVDVETLLLCLKRLRKSVEKWTKHEGRQGYLHFMSQFVK